MNFLLWWKLICISIYNSSNLCVCVCLFVCLSVCLRPPFLDDRRSDLIETCKEYCRGPPDVPFRGFISIGQAVPKLRPFYCFFSVEKVYIWQLKVSFHLLTLSCHFYERGGVTILLLRLIWRHNWCWGPDTAGTKLHILARPYGVWFSVL